MSEPTAPPQVSPDGRFYWDGQKWVPFSSAAEATQQPVRTIRPMSPPTDAPPAPAPARPSPAPAALSQRSNRGRVVLLVALPIAFVVALGVCARTSGNGVGPIGSHTVYIEVGSGDSAFYLVSDNLDPTSFPDDANSFKVSGLPNGAVQVCQFTTSQGVTLKVWSTGSAASNELARAECYREGQ